MLPIASARTAWLICAGVFAASFLLQAHFWSGFEFTDSGMWSSTVTAFEQGRAWNAAPETVNDTALIYPATTIHISASALIAAGFPPSLSLQLAAAFLLSLATAAAACVAYVARPQSWWWLGVSALLLSDRLYQSATLASVVIIPFTVLLVALCIQAYERPEARWAVVSIGITTGLMLATRFDISAALGASAAMLLLYSRRFCDIGIIAAISAALFLIFGPFWVLSPSGYISLYAAMARFAATLHSTVSWGSFFDTNGPYMAIAGMAIGSFMMLIPAKARRPIPTAVFWWLLISTAVIGGLMLSSHGWQTRYFYPLYSIWDALFILFVFDLIQTGPTLTRFALLRKRTLSLLFVISIIAAQMPGSLMYTFIMSTLGLR